jgi:hypothetical protein
MSYVSQGVIGLIIGIVLVFAILGILLVIFSVIMLAYGLSEMVPGTQPGRCGLWGHDWRPQLPMMASGTSCRNCLVRKDGALFAWRFQPPMIPTVFAPNLGLFIPQNAVNWGRRHPARAVIAADDPRMPMFPLVPGAPLPMPPAPQIVAQFAGPPPAAPYPALQAAPQSAQSESLCRACFTPIPALATNCPSCGAPRAA